MDKLGINIVGPVDSLTRLYNVGNGFRGMTGVISMDAASALYLLFTADRAYDVTVGGDLVVTREATENGVTPFNVDWSEASLRRARKSGTVTITNPDAPDEVSSFTVNFGAPFVNVDFGNVAEVCVRAVVTMDTDISKFDREIAAVLKGADSRRSRQARELVGAPASHRDYETFGGEDLASLRRNILT
jgi:hypothetical protein